MITGSDHAWQKWGVRDPYYAVYAEEKFRSGQIDERTREEFFRSGEQHIDRVLSVIRERLKPGFRPSSALDFGCGVGRLLVRLSQCTDRVVGVDVSEGMLAEARRNMEEMNIANVTLVGSDDRLSQVPGSFDLVHSHIVLQHIPVRRGMGVIGELLARLNSGGVAFLQVTYGRVGSPLRRTLNGMIRRSRILSGVSAMLRGTPWGDPPMQMNLYDTTALLALFRANGVGNVFVQLREGLGYSSAEFWCLKDGSPL
jgi:SAM-dependent methyltransferase